MLKRISCFFLMFWAFVFTFSAVVYADEYEDHLNEWMKQFNPDTGSTENNPEKDFPVPYAESTEVEPNNNNRFTCPSININDIVTGYLQEKGDIDCLKFEATKDTKIVVTLDNVPLGYTHALWLQDANGNPLASATRKNEVCHTISYNVTKGNTYIIVAYGPGNVLSSMQYKLSLTEVPQATTILPVGWTKQEKTNWCWLACSEMVIKYEDSTFTKGDYSSRQSKLSMLAQNNLENKTGNTVQIMQLANTIVTDGTFDNVNYRSLTTDAKFTTYAYNQLMTTKHPVLINFYTAKPPYTASSRLVGHSCVMYGYNSSNQKYYVYDPFYTYSRSDNLITHNVTKAGILDGFTIATWNTLTWYGGTVIVY